MCKNMHLKQSNAAFEFINICMSNLWRLHIKLLETACRFFKSSNYYVRNCMWIHVGVPQIVCGVAISQMYICQRFGPFEKLYVFFQKLNVELFEYVCRICEQVQEHQYILHLMMAGRVTDIWVILSMCTKHAQNRCHLFVLSCLCPGHRVRGRG